MQSHWLVISYMRTPPPALATTQPDMFKLVHLGSPCPTTHTRTYSELFRFVHTSVLKRTLGIQLKFLLVKCKYVNCCIIHHGKRIFFILLICNKVNSIFYLILEVLSSFRPDRLMKPDLLKKWTTSKPSGF